MFAIGRACEKTLPNELTILRPQEFTCDQAAAYDAGSMLVAAENPDTKRTRILRIDEVMHRTGDSRSTIYRLDKRGILRRAKQLAECHSAGWLEDSVDAYIESRRPDTVHPPDGIEHGQVKASKSPVLIHPDAGPDRTSAGKGPATIVTPGRVSSDLQATTMMIMGNRVYLHVPTGKLLMEIGKAPASAAGMNTLGSRDDVEASNSAGSGPAKRKRRMAD